MQPTHLQRRSETLQVLIDPYSSAQTQFASALAGAASSQQVALGGFTATEAARRLAECGYNELIEAFEDCVSVRHKRMEVHRHDYVELFWLQGYGSVLIDFENYPLSGKSLIAIGPGRVHAWQVKKLTGLYIAFTQEFFDETRPPPSALFDYPFVFGGEVSPVVRLKPKQGEQAQNLFREISHEFQQHENLAVEMIHHQLRSLMVHLVLLC
jgi:hypothetical protein